MYGDTWLKIYVRATQEPLTKANASWRAALLAGAFRDAAKSQRVATVLGFDYIIEYSKGRSLRSGAAIAGDFDSEVSDASIDELMESIRKRYEPLAERAGISRVSVSFVQPIRLAPIVDVTARDPAVLTREISALTMNDLEGWFLSIRTEDGRPFAYRSVSTRSRRAAGSGPGLSESQ